MIRQKIYTVKNDSDFQAFIDDVSKCKEFEKAESVLIKGLSSNIPYYGCAKNAELLAQKLPKAQSIGFAVNNRDSIFLENSGVTLVQFFEHTKVKTFAIDCEGISYEEAAQKASSYLDEFKNLKAVEIVSSATRHGLYNFINLISKGREDVYIFGIECGHILKQMMNIKPDETEFCDECKVSDHAHAIIEEMLLSRNRHTISEEEDDFGLNQDSRYVLRGDRILLNGIVMIAYDSDSLKIHPEYMFGWKSVGKELTVTRMKTDDCVETIDNAPASEIYQKYLNVKMDSSLLRNVSEFPLVTVRNGFEIPRIPPLFDTDKRLYFSADIYEGEKLRFSYANAEQIIKQAHSIAGPMHEFNPELLTIYVCGNHLIFMGEKHELEIAPFRQIRDDVLPILGNSEIYRYQNQGGVLNSMLIAIGMREEELPDGYCELNIRKFHNKHDKDGENISGILPLSERLSYFLGVITDELSEAVDEAKRANEAKSQFLSNMSHEIRTPINTILGMNELILRESKDSRIMEYAQNISQAGSSLLGLINDILDFSKIEAGKLEIIENEYFLETCLSEIYALLSYRAKNKGLSFTFNIDPDIPSVMIGDDLRIKQIIVNILTNAIKYTKEGGVELSIRKLSGNDKNCRLRISVTDTGIGIKKEELPKLCAAFERIDEQRNRTIEGTGLGMSITSKLLKMMQSSLEVSSVYGKGSTFFFDLEQKIANASPLGEFSLRHELRRQKKYHESFVAPDARILVVDDTVMNLTVILGLLKNTRMKIDTAQSGAEALRLFDSNNYNLILLDHRMPEMDGVETLEKLREKEKFKTNPVKVIALTANAISGARKFYLDAGFDDYLTKPVDPVILEKTIASYLPEELKTAADPKELNAAAAEENSAHVLPDFLYNIKSLDTDMGIRNCGSEDNYLTSLRIFADSVEDSSAELERLARNQDYRNFTIKVHALKSSSRIIGAKELSEKAKRLEDAGNNGYFEEIEAELPSLLELYRSYDEALSSIKTEAAVNDEAGESINENDLAEAKESLVSAVDDYDIDTIFMILQMLENYTLDTKTQALITQISKAAQIPDWDKLTLLLHEERK